MGRSLQTPRSMLFFASFTEFSDGDALPRPVEH
jgi:hypothetical protein